MRILLGVLGGLVFLFCLFCVIAAVGDLASGKEEPAKMIGLMVFFGGAAYGGYRLMRHGFAKVTSAVTLEPGEREQRVLALASSAKGRLTIAEVALLPGFDVDSARETLDRLCQKDVAILEVSNVGVVVYTFDGLRPGEKETAQNPLA